MRLAVISDVHGNLTALEAVVADIEHRGVDQVVHGGDVALIGARPAEVIDRLAELGWSGIVGNTDELLWRPGQFTLQLRAAPKLEPYLWRAPMPDASEEELESTYSRVGSQIVIYGHIHRPFVHQIGALTVANAGSVGLPWDGDSRASYLLIEDHRAEVIRVEYAVETEVAALRASGYPDADRIAEMLCLGRFVRVARS
jgi:putative phosphoesterase